MAERESILNVTLRETTPEHQVQYRPDASESARKIPSCVSGHDPIPDGNRLYRSGNSICGRNDGLISAAVSTVPQQAFLNGAFQLESH